MKIIRYCQGIVISVLICTLLTSLYTTPAYADHYRNLLWLGIAIFGYLSFGLAAAALPYDRGITPFVIGLFNGSILSLIIDNADKGVENYWTIGNLFTCLPDFIIWFGCIYVILRFSIMVVVKYGKELQEA